MNLTETLRLSHVALSPEGEADLMLMISAVKSAQLRTDMVTARRLAAAVHAAVDAIVAIDRILEADTLEEELHSYGNRSGLYIHPFRAPRGVKAYAFAFACDGREGAMSPARGVLVVDEDSRKAVVTSLGVMHDQVYAKARRQLFEAA